MPVHVLDPTHEDDTEVFVPATRPADLRGATVGIVSNGKQGTGRFFDALAAELQSAYGVGDVVRVTKPNYSAPAGDDIIDRAKQWTVLVAGVGD